MNQPVKKRGPSEPDGPDKSQARDNRIRVVCIVVGFVLLALAFMWTQSLKGAYDASRVALEKEYAAKLAAVGRDDEVRVDPYAHTALPENVESDDVDMGDAAVEIASYQNDFVSVITEFDGDMEAYKTAVLSAWDNMEQWFPNDSAHAWYVWSPKRATASWRGYDSTDAADRPMGIWICESADGTLLSYAMAWYAGDHMFTGWSCHTTQAGWSYMDTDEETGDPTAGTYDVAPGDSDVSEDRSLEDHIDSAQTILDGLGMTHNWYDEMIREAQAAEESDGGTGGSDG